MSLVLRAMELSDICSCDDETINNLVGNVLTESYKEFEEYKIDGEHKMEDRKRLYELSFESFMKRGLTRDLIHEIISEYGEKCSQYININSMADKPSMKFLDRYDRVCITPLLQQLADASKNVYADENYSITNFSSKFMHDLNVFYMEQNVTTRHNEMKEYMKGIAEFIKKNIYVCRNMGFQDDKHNLPGLYYKLFMAHVPIILNKDDKRDSMEDKLISNNGWISGSTYIYYPDDLYKHMTLLIIYAFIHVQHDVQELALYLFSQYVLRTICTVHITSNGNNAAHVAVMCNDLAGIIGLMNDPELWNQMDSEGLLPVEKAMLAMFYTTSTISIANFIASCIKYDIIEQNKCGTESVENLFHKRINFIYDIFLFILSLDSQIDLDIYSKGFFDIYGHIWKTTTIISEIPASVSLYCLDYVLFFSKLNEIFHSILEGTYSKEKSLSAIVQTAMSENRQEKTYLLKYEFAPFASVPMVLEEIKNRIVYNSYFSAPRTTYVCLPLETEYIDQEDSEAVFIDTPLYSAMFLNWSPFFKHLAHNYDFSLHSASALNDINSVYAYALLLGTVEYCADVKTLIQLLKDKLKKVGGNGKPHKGLKYKSNTV
jgi:uncharacterized membrane protein